MRNAHQRYALFRALPDMHLQASQASEQDGPSCPKWDRQRDLLSDQHQSEAKTVKRTCVLSPNNVQSNSLLELAQGNIVFIAEQTSKCSVVVRIDSWQSLNFCLISSFPSFSHADVRSDTTFFYPLVSPAKRIGASQAALWSATNASVLVS